LDLTGKKADAYNVALTLTLIVMIGSVKNPLPLSFSAYTARSEFIALHTLGCAHRAGRTDNVKKHRADRLNLRLLAEPV